MKNILAIFILLLSLQSHSTSIDSLKTILKTNIHDTSRIKILTAIGENTYMGGQDTALKYWELGLIECDNYLNQNPKDTFGNISKAALISNIGIIYYYRGQMDTVIKLWTKAAEIEASVGFEKGTIGTYNNMAQIHITNGNMDKAIDLLEKSLELSKKYDDKVHVAKVLGNIGYCYSLQGKTIEAIKIYEKSNEYVFKNSLEKENEELVAYNYGGLFKVYLNVEEFEKAVEFLHKERDVYHRKGFKRKYYETINNEGQVYSKLEKLDSAISFFNLSVSGFDSIEYSKGKAISLSNLASCYNRKENYRRAKELNFSSLKINKEINYVSGIQSNYHILALTFLGLSQIDSAEYYGVKAYEIAQELNQIEFKSKVVKTLSKIYNQKREYKKAFDFLTIHKELSDSLINDEIKKEALKSEFEFEFTSEKILLEKEQEKREALASEKDLRQKVIIFSIAIILILVIISAIIIYNRLKITRSQNVIINNQKIEVEEKNNEILSSISYAKRIQTAILPSEEEVNALLPNNFVYYEPKDIVSGDFYWVQKSENKVFFAAVDCTGHGVPGAFMSIVGNNGLNKALNEKRITQPSKILDSLNLHVVESLQKKADDRIKDGMDLAICAIDYQKLLLEYSGAYNPLYLIRNNELIETKADKQAIGLANKEYTNHKFELQKGDVIYLFTDGYADQFGGPKGKKFTYKRFKQLLIEISKKPIAEQKNILEKTLHEWMKNEEQIDDICLMGITV